MASTISQHSDSNLWRRASQCEEVGTSITESPFAKAAPRKRAQAIEEGCVATIELDFVAMGLMSYPVVKAARQMHCSCRIVLELEFAP
jgi:hypothetical protein